MKTLPRLNASYWTTLVAASVFGGNSGDFLSDVLGLGHFAGLPFLAGALALIFAIEKWSKLSTPVLFWAAILIVRTAATNIGDIFHDYHVSFAVSIPVVALLMTSAMAIYALVGGEERRQDGVRVDWSYWLCIALAGILGTVLGDGASFGAQLGTLGSTMLFFLPFLAVMALGRRTSLAAPFVYWPTIVLIRSAGTAFGDFLAHGVFGLAASTVVTGIVYVGLIAWFYGARRQANVYHQALPASATA